MSHCVVDQERVGLVPRSWGQTGYVPRHPRAYRAFNAVVASVLFLLAAPLILGFAIALRASQGPHVIARSSRLGKDKHVFDLYRFATIGHDRLNPAKYKGLRPTRLGIYLRETGLDGLPQLINVIKGDMNLLGPRPVRGAIARIEEARDPLYATRFAVKPGLTGHTQAVMGSGASQRVRGKLTYRLCRTTVSVPVALLLLGRTALASLGQYFRQIAKPRRRDGHLTRARRKAQDLNVQIETEAGRYPVYALSQGLLTTPHVVTGGPARIVFGVGQGIRKAKVELGRLSHLQGETVFQYLPANENAAHLVSRYLRDEALLRPRRPDWQPPRLSDLQYELDLHVARETVPLDLPKR